MALHNFNILMGEKPDAPRHAADSITQSVPPLQEIAPEEAVPSHPSYLIAGKQIDLERYNVRLAASRFNPQLSAGVQGIWNTPSPNYHGQTRIDGLAFSTGTNGVIRSMRPKRRSARRSMRRPPSRTTFR